MFKASTAFESSVTTRKGLPFRLPFEWVQPSVIAADFIVIIATSVVTGVAYCEIFLGSPGTIQTFLAIGFLVSFNFSAMSVARGNYQVRRLLNFPEEARDVTVYWALICSLLLAVSFSLKITQSFSRGATLSFFVLGWVTILVWRRILKRVLVHALAEGGFAEHKILLIAEDGQLASSKLLRDLQPCGFNPVKTFRLKPHEIDAIDIKPSLRAKLDDIIETSRREQIEEIFLSIGWNHRIGIESIINALRVLPLPIHLVPDENVARFLSDPLVSIGDARLIELKRPPLTSSEQLLKRTIDVLSAGLALVPLSPLMLLIALLIKLDSKGPVWFTQTRHGFNGRDFRILKFRTMCVLEDGPLIRQATRNDPRVTRLGRLLRHMNLDELPQLFNVVGGDMSLVGPRPHAAAHDTEYEKLIANYAFRQHMKPGMTGWAQINGLRGETPTVDLMARRVELDLWYINNWSVWLDITILLKTLLMGRQRSAY
jgi:Undecaprenyl-phosphate glucose phosphotransferase